MAENSASSDHIIATLLDMGFELSKAIQAVASVGSSLDSAIDFILNNENKEQEATQGRLTSDANCSFNKTPPSGMKSTNIDNSHRLKQSRIIDHLSTLHRPTTIRSVGLPKKSNPHLGCSNGVLVKGKTSNSSHQSVSNQPTGTPNNMILSDVHLEEKTKNVLLQKFGLSSLKSFQKKALDAWTCNRDCLVLAATGSGKSLCFQLPAVLSQKVTIVISPLISLMRDQCLKLSKHGISACFLGSGQLDSSIEKKAMCGLYDLVYVCPETVLRLVGPLQTLAENRGIALFAIDEAHCVSKWGHDFRPDYRRLSIIRETFKAGKMKCLEWDIPLMALTATATVPVRKDIIKSLLMSEEVEIIITSFFRPNLRFSVKHSRTSNTSSYERDFSELIDTYSAGKKNREHFGIPSYDSPSNDQGSDAECPTSDDSSVSRSSEECSISEKIPLSDGDRMTVEFLEDDLDIEAFDNLDGEMRDQSIPYQSMSELSHEICRPSAQGTTIVYVPTRKETVKIAGFLCKYGVKAAPYHALLPKHHLKSVHEEFHCGKIQVVVATVAFGMGIDKSDVRKIIHYGWPQSLEAYYQEAGRAGRDGKISDCVLYANLSRAPTLLPSRRTDDQNRHAHAMLYDCFRYGVNVSSCRSKILVKYFGEDFFQDKCGLCDVCLNNHPEQQDYQEEAKAFMQVLAAQFERLDDRFSPLSDEPINFRMILSGIREQYKKYSSSDRVWWQGLGRILMDKGFIKERDGMIRIGVKFPEPTDLGMKFLNSGDDRPLYAYPEADMMISIEEEKPFSSFSGWARGWADPEVRRQRLQGMGKWRGERKRKSYPRRRRPDPSTARGRISAKLAKLSK